MLQEAEGSGIGKEDYSSSRKTITFRIVQTEH